MIALAYAVPLGVVAGWSGVLDMILTPAKVSQVSRRPGSLAHTQSQARSTMQLHVHAHAHTHTHTYTPVHTCTQAGSLTHSLENMF